MELLGRTAVVTGASRGIGYAISAALLAGGVRLAAVAREAAGLEKAARRLREEAGDRLAEPVLVRPADVGDPEAVGRLFDSLRADLGRLDILVNAAGVLHRGPVEHVPFAEWQESLRVNLTGVFLCSQAAARLMLEQEPGEGGLRGHIVQIVSGAGVHAWAGAAAYTASKFGVMGLSEVLRDELRERGVKVTTVLPGMVATDMTDHPDFAQRHKLDARDVAQAVLAVVTASADVMLTRVDVRHRLPL